MGYSFIEGARRTAKSVACLKVPGYFRGEPDPVEGMWGTGWLITPTLLITNFHVVNPRQPLPDGTLPQVAGDDLALQARNTEIRFDWYQGDPPGEPNRGSELIAYSKECDYAILDLGSQPAGAGRTALPVVRQQRQPAQGSRINIVQHSKNATGTGNGPMLFAIRNNFFVRSTPKGELRYQTDTEAGASGSPVCDDEWQVLGLHHCAVKVDPTLVPQEFKKGQLQEVTLLNEAISMWQILTDLDAHWGAVGKQIQAP